MGAVPDPAGAGDLLAGRYEVGPLVGLGGTAQVYRAWDHDRGRPVAVKMFRPGSAPAPGYGGERELQALAGISHPGLVGLHDSGVDTQGCPFVVMDFVDGRSLAGRLHEGPLPAARVARLGSVLADALAAVHARGVVHRDVKPANVLLDADDRPWLTDFGIARIVDATRVTATGVVVGTAAYMAPEQVRGEPVGPAADVYSLGLVLLEAVTGRREYEGGALESALARLHRAPLVPAGVPDPLAATVRRMTALDPDERPAAAEVAALLSGDPRGANPARTAVSRTARRRAVPVAALASLVAAALAGALALTGGQTSTPEDPADVAVAAAPPVVVVPQNVGPPPSVAEVAEQQETVAREAAAAPQPVPVALRNPVAEPAPATVERSRGRGPDRSRPAKDDSAGDRADDDRRTGDRGSADDDDRRGADHESDEGDDGGKAGTEDEEKHEDGAGAKDGDDRDDDAGKSGKGGKHGDGDRSGSNSGKG